MHTEITDVDYRCGHPGWSRTVTVTDDAGRDVLHAMWPGSSGPALLTRTAWGLRDAQALHKYKRLGGYVVIPLPA
jgi:hypothetical protein